MGIYKTISVWLKIRASPAGYKLKADSVRNLTRLAMQSDHQQCPGAILHRLCSQCMEGVTCPKVSCGNVRSDFLWFA